MAGDKTITYTLDKLERGNRIATDTGYFVEGMYEYSYKRVYGIEDFSKHNIILFQSDMPAERHNYVYNQFEFLVNGLYNEYDYNLGITPKINLIGHSRGGIINLMYATRHPYNVSNLFSLGTPYNGSRLGKITSLASLLGLEESLNCPSGQDIQDNRIQSTLKNEWNKMLIDHPDANINAIAFQSCTTLDLIKNILNSGELEAYFNNENDSKLQNFLIKFITNLTTKAIDKINSNPKFYTAVIKSAVELGIDFASIGAEPLEKDELEAAKEVFDNTYAHYGKVVIYDDLFIDYESQGAEGYNGFIRETKIFKDGSYNSSKKCVNAPGIPHNLEARDFEIISKALSLISFGNASENLGEIILNNEIHSTSKNYTLTYIPKIDSIYKVDGKNIDTIKVKNLTDNTFIELNDGIISLKKNIQYRFYISSISPNSSFMLRTLTLDELMNNSYTLESNDSICVEIPNEGLINIDANNNFIKLETLNDLYQPLVGKKSRLAIEACDAAYLYITNTNNEAVTLSLSNIIPNTVYIGNSSINSNDCVYKFVAPKDFVYTITLKAPGDCDIIIYDETYLNKITLTKLITKENRLYTVSLKANQVVYLLPKASSNSNVEINLDYSKYQWKVNGELITENEFHIINNNVDSLTIYYCLNGEALQGNLGVVTGNAKYSKITTDNNFEYQIRYYNPDVVSFINEELALTYSPASADKFFIEGSIRIIVDPYFDIKLEQNGLLIDDYQLRIINNSQAYIGRMPITIKIRVENSISHNVMYITYSNKENNLLSIKTNNLKFMSGVNKVSVYEVVIGEANNICTYSVEANAKLFKNPNIVVSENCYIDNGDGSYSTPYLITSQRELQNIDLLRQYDDYTMEYYISGEFKQTTNLDIRGTFKPIRSTFKGNYNGGNYRISGIVLQKDANKNFGLFEKVENAIIKNLNIYNSSLHLEIVRNVNAGWFCGSAVSTTFEGCKLSDSVINCQEKGKYILNVGGIAGQAHSCNFNLCHSYGNIIESTGNAGGIAGYAQDCHFMECVNRSNVSINYAVNLNPCAGGIIGVGAYGTLIERCENYNEIAYVGAKSDDKNLLPYMGQFCGKAVGEVRIIGQKNSGVVNRGNLRYKKNWLGIVVLDQTKYVKDICGNKYLGK